LRCFRSIRKLSQHPQSDVLSAVDDIDRIISDIQFLGNEEQIEAAKKLHEEVIAKRSADLDALMDVLRRELCKELGRSDYQGKIFRIKATKKSQTEKLKEGSTT